MTKGFGDAFRNDVPQVILQALTGGGSPMPALASMFGSKFGENMVSKFGERITGALGNTLGGALNTILPGIGGLIGPLLMKGLGKVGGFVKQLFGGPSAKENEGRSTAREFEESIIAALTPTQRAEAGTTRWKQVVVGVRDAYLATGKSAAEAEAMVKRLWEAERQGPEAVRAVQQEISSVMNDWKQDQEDLNSAIERYGFTIEELGPKFAKQKLDEQAALLMNDFRLLTDATGNVDLVINKMSGSINEFIGQALRTGTEVPASMKPMLQKMVEMGLLTDASGNKIEDLEGSGLTFSETMTQGFDRIVKKFDELISKMTKDFPNAIGNIKVPEVSVPVRWDIPDMPSGLENDYRPRMPDMEGAAAGGMFSRPTLRVIAESKPEMVGSPDVFANAFRQALGDVNAGGSEETSAAITKLSESIQTLVRLPVGNINFEVNTLTGGGDDVRQLVYQKLGPMFLEWIASNSGSSRTQLRNILNA